MEITKRLGETAYSILWEQKPDSVIDIPLAQVGFWLKLKSPISQFSAEIFIQEIERQLAGINWANFNKGTVKPDWTLIKSVWKLPLGYEIVRYLKSHKSDYFQIPTDPVQMLHDAMLSHELQKKICAWLNERELQTVTDKMATLSGQDDILIRKRSEFLQSCQSLLNDWFAGTDLPTPQLDKTGISPNSISQLSRWEDLIMTFTDDDTVEIRLRGKEPIRQGFKELGFKDKRNTDRPNLQWGILKKMAAFDGALPLNSHEMRDTMRSRTEGRVRRLRKALQIIFKLDQDPISKKKDKPYQCSFQLFSVPYVQEQFSISHEGNSEDFTDQY
ncbi:MAG: hypothetical protein FVQ79_08390 [Planctomycetes bacterium]|nr:hypothetical protein [Planctomycetota bacterium]